MLKYIILGVLLYVVYKFFFQPKLRTNASSTDEESQIMIECSNSNCSTFVSQNESILKDGKAFCSKECAGA